MEGIGVVVEVDTAEASSTTNGKKEEAKDLEAEGRTSIVESKDLSTVENGGLLEASYSSAGLSSDDDKTNGDTLEEHGTLERVGGEVKEVVDLNVLSNGCRDTKL
jgi:hypothetical protein